MSYRNELLDDKKVSLLEEEKKNEQMNSARIKMADSTKSLENTLRMIKDAEKLGRSTQSQLDSQKDQIIKAQSSVYEIQSTLRSADKVTRRMQRSWYNPKTWF
jgi:hypothetical protein